MVCVHSSGVFLLGVFFPEGGMGAPGFCLFFPPPSRLLTFSFILADARCPSSTCRVNLSKTDICPVSLIPKSLGVVDKAEESGSAGCIVLSGKGNKGSFPEIF